MHDESHFKYVETGSYMGLSAHIITASVLDSGVPILSYCHDLFNEAITEIWQLTGLYGRTNLQRFYDNVKRNNFAGNIIPIIGNLLFTSTSKLLAYTLTPSYSISTYINDPGESWKTLNIHEDNSVDLVFIDGDHTYEGSEHCFMCMYSIFMQ